MYMVLYYIFLWSQTGLVLRPMVSDHITISYCNKIIKIIILLLQ